MPDIHPKIPWARLAEVLIVSRFCEPSSELHIAEHFCQNSALSDLLGVPDEEIHANRLYRALDRMLEHKDSVQQYLSDGLLERDTRPKGEKQPEDSHDLYTTTLLSYSMRCLSH
jgi:hypothetical protein